MVVESVLLTSAFLFQLPCSMKFTFSSSEGKHWLCSAPTPRLPRLFFTFCSLPPPIFPVMPLTSGAFFSVAGGF